MKLRLKRVMPGYYENITKDVRITLSNPYRMLKDGSNAWQLIIEVNDVEVVNEWFDTKKAASSFGAELIYTL